VSKRKQVPSTLLSVQRVPRASREAPDPAGRKQPRKQPALLSDDDDRLVVQFGRIDLDSDWRLTKITKADHRALLDRIASIEQMTVHEVFSQDGRIGKDYPLNSASLPNKDAQRRLSDLQLDDLDRISQLRIGSRQRLYGQRVGARFYALWWDPHHEIWPSNK
jgi:hypothetical protein